MQAKDACGFGFSRRRAPAHGSRTALVFAAGRPENAEMSPKSTLGRLGRAALSVAGGCPARPAVTTGHQTADGGRCGLGVRSRCGARPASALGGSIAPDACRRARLRVELGRLAESARTRVLTWYSASRDCFREFDRSRLDWRVRSGCQCARSRVRFRLLDPVVQQLAKQKATLVQPCDLNSVLATTVLAKQRTTAS